MTEPTDKQLEDFAVEEQFLLFCDVDEFTQIARAVLAKWGAPQQEAQEPVFAFRRKGLDDFCTCTEERYAELSAKPNLFETRIFYTTPQTTQAQAYTPCRKNPFYHGPRNCIRGTVGCCEDHGAKPQAQAGAVPLTDEQIEALPMWKRFVGLWPETRREIVRIIESAHGIGIKGGQHGTE